MTTIVAQEFAQQQIENISTFYTVACTESTRAIPLNVLCASRFQDIPDRVENLEFLVLTGMVLKTPLTGSPELIANINTAKK